MAYAATPMRLEAHRDALARLWAENMSDPRVASAIPDRLRWLYEEAPSGPATTVLAVHVETGDVVGCGSYLERPTWIAGHRVRGGVLCDFAVTRAHRNAGAALTVQRGLVEAAQAAGVQVLYGYPNEKSLAVFKRIGYRVIGETTSWVKALRSAYKLREVLPVSWAAPALAVPIDAGLRLLDVARGLRGPRVRVEPGVRLDDRADALWERARGAFGAAPERSSSYLDWRYVRFTSARHHVLGISPAHDARLAGYAAWDVLDGKAFLRELLTEGTASVAPLLLAVSDRLRRAGVDSLSLAHFGSAAFGEELRRVGFVRRPARRSVVLHADSLPEPFRARALDPKSWFMLDGELDI